MQATHASPPTTLDPLALKPSPSSKDGEVAAQKAAAARIQHAAALLQCIGQASLKRDELAVRRRLSKLLTPLANVIPATPNEIRTASEFLCQRHITQNSSVPGIPSTILLSQPDEKGFRSFLVPLKNLHPPPEPGAWKATEGSYKQVFGSLAVTCSPCGRLFCAEQKALISMKNGNIPPNVIRGFDLYRIVNELAARKSVSIYLAPAYRTLLPEKHYEQDWAHSDLFEAMKKRSVASSFNPAIPSRPFTVNDALLCVLQAARTLQFCHGEGFALRDVKQKNVLIFYKKEKEAYEGAITDFDYFNHFGWDPKGIQHDYEFWDPLAVCNVTAPTVDLFGLIILMMEIWGGKGKMNYQRVAAIRNEIMRAMTMGETPSLKHEENSSPFEYLLKLVCYQSMSTLLFILNKRKNVSAEFSAIRDNTIYLPWNDTYLSMLFLKDLTDKHKDLFTSDAVSAATAQVKETMKEKGDEACTIEYLIEVLEERIR